jgi:hypothetical protein
MTDSFDDLREFLERRFQDRPDRDGIPEAEILAALIEWAEAGYQSMWMTGGLACKSAKDFTSIICTTYRTANTSARV